jgi:hypothetical protein
VDIEERIRLLCGSFQNYRIDAVKVLNGPDDVFIFSVTSHRSIAKQNWIFFLLFLFASLFLVISHFSQQPHSHFSPYLCVLPIAAKTCRNKGGFKWMELLFAPYGSPTDSYK